MTAEDSRSGPEGDARSTVERGAVGFDSIIVWGGTIVSAGLLLAFWSLVVRARVRVGEWPHPRSGNPFDGSYVDSSIDPGVFGFHESLVWLGVLPLVVLVPLATIAILLSLFVRRLRQPAWIVGTFVLSNFLIAMTVLFDPHGFFDWFLD